MQLNWRDDKQQQLEFELDKVHTFLDIDWIYRGKVHRRHSYPENGENYHVILQPNQWSSQTIPTQSWGTIKIDFLTVADPPLPYQRHIHSVHPDGSNIYTGSDCVNMLLPYPPDSSLNSMSKFLDERSLCEATLPSLLRLLDIRLRRSRHRHKYLHPLRMAVMGLRDYRGRHSARILHQEAYGWIAHGKN